MFRELRRGRQALPEAESLAILERGSHGVLAVLGDGGYPYAVPLNYVYEGARYISTAPAPGTSTTPSWPARARPSAS